MVSTWNKKRNHKWSLTSQWELQYMKMPITPLKSPLLHSSGIARFYHVLTSLYFNYRFTQKMELFWSQVSFPECQVFFSVNVGYWTCFYFFIIPFVKGSNVFTSLCSGWLTFPDHYTTLSGGQASTVACTQSLWLTPLLALHALGWPLFSLRFSHWQYLPTQSV